MPPVVDLHAGAPRRRSDRLKHLLHLTAHDPYGRAAAHEWMPTTRLGMGLQWKCDDDAAARRRMHTLDDDGTHE